jgi:hypothetical protein
MIKKRVVSSTSKKNIIFRYLSGRGGAEKFKTMVVAGG